MSDPIFREGAKHIPWTDLPPYPGTTAKFIDGQLMEREQYDAVGYRLEGFYTCHHPHRPGCLLEPTQIPMWRAPLAGLHEYGQLRELRRSERKEVWRNRQAADDAWSAQIESQIEREPTT